MVLTIAESRSKIVSMKLFQVPHHLPRTSDFGCCPFYCCSIVFDSLLLPFHGGFVFDPYTTLVVQ